MRKKITIINPTPMSKIKRIKKRKKRVLKRRRVLRNKTKSINLKRSAAVATKTRKRRTKRRAVRKNPGGVTYIKNRKRVRSRRRSSRRLFKNPFDSSTGSRATDLLVMSAGAAGGGIVAPWLGNIFQLQGMTKFAAQAAIALAGYYGLGKIGMRKAALPFAAGAIAVTAYQFAQENNILAGLGNTELTPQDLANMQQISSGIGAVYPQIGAVYPEIGSVNMNLGAAKFVESDDNSLHEEYTDAAY